MVGGVLWANSTRAGTSLLRSIEPCGRLLLSQVTKSSTSADFDFSRISISLVIGFGTKCSSESRAATDFEANPRRSGNSTRSRLTSKIARYPFAPRQLLLAIEPTDQRSGSATSPEANCSSDLLEPIFLYCRRQISVKAFLVTLSRPISVDYGRQELLYRSQRVRKDTNRLSPFLADVRARTQNQRDGILVSRWVRLATRCFTTLSPKRGGPCVAVVYGQE